MSGRENKVPERIAWAVDLLDVGPDDEILEIGCGPGVAVSLICARLYHGRITGIDRSAHAIGRATERNAEHIAEERAVLRRTDLAAFASDPDQFDKVFAVNVNVFWTSDADPELEILASVLRPGGSVHLVYAGPSPEGPATSAPPSPPKLKRYGFTSSVSYNPTGPFTCITGQLLNSGDA